MTVVQLSRSYTAHKQVFDTVELREPTYRDIYMSGLGMPFEWQRAAAGNSIRIEYPEIIDAYVTRLAIAPTAENLGGLSAIDSRKVVDALFDFFMEPPKMSSPPPTISSSDADGTPEPSQT